LLRWKPQKKNDAGPVVLGESFCRQFSMYPYKALDNFWNFENIIYLTTGEDILPSFSAGRDTQKRLLIKQQRSN